MFLVDGLAPLLQSQTSPPDRLAPRYTRQGNAQPTNHVGTDCPVPRERDLRRNLKGTALSGRGETGEDMDEGDKMRK